MGGNHIIYGGCEMKILFLSHTYWDSVFRVGSHQLANVYLKNGHEVYYISTPLSFFHCFGKLRGNKHIIKRFHTRKAKKENGLFTYIPFKIIPFKNIYFFRNKKNAITNDLIFMYSFNKIKRKYDIDNFDLVLIDSPHLAFILNNIKYKKCIYRITDFYSMMEKKYFKEVEEVEKYIIENKADYIIATSLPIKSYFDKKYNIECKLFENGVDILNFDRKVEKPQEYIGRKHIVVYVGSLDKRFNWDYLLYSVINNPNINFFIIGPNDKKIQMNYSNLFLLGSRNYEDVPKYLKYADVAILPLTKSIENNGRSPMKLYEYGICGLPVITNYSEEVARRNLSFVFLTKNNKEFSDKIKEIIFDSNIESIRLQAYKDSKKHDWTEIANAILNI